MAQLAWVAACCLVLVASGDDPFTARLKKGLGALSKQKFKKGLKHFKKAVELEPSREQGYKGVAQAYISIGKPMKAVAAMKTAVELPGVKGADMLATISDLYAQHKSGSRWDEAEHYAL